MLRAVLVEEKRRKNANASKSHYCPSGKTVKASGQSCNIYIKPGKKKVKAT